MKAFDQEAIKASGEYFEKNFTPTREQAGGELLDYYVVPASMNPEIHNFVMRMTPPESEQTYQVSDRKPEFASLYGVSDAVPEPLRKYFVLHEVFEFIHHGREQPDRCVSSEREVLAAIEQEHPELVEDYKAQRRILFGDLIAYFEKDIEASAGNFTQADLAEIKATADLLETKS